MKKYMFFDDFEVGQSFRTQGKTFSETEILQFGMIYDPQPLHMDVESAKKNVFGGLVASGFHTLSICFSLFVRFGILEKANMGSPGLDAVRWLVPVRPGDTLWSEAEVTEVVPSKSKPDRGVVAMEHRMVNQKDEVVMTVQCKHFVSREPLENLAH